MKKKFGLFVLSLCNILLVYSQLSEPGLPESFAFKTKSFHRIADTVFNSLDTALLQENDRKTGIDNRYGVVNSVHLDIKKEGTKSNIPGRGTIWQYKINSPGSPGLGIAFQLYLLPAGAKVFIYNERHTELLGAFTQMNNNSKAMLTLADVKSDNAIIEYFEPLDPEFEGELVIGSITQAYRTIAYSDVSLALSRIYINCPLGDNWQDEKHAVCRMTFKEGSSAYLCTGFLVNNTQWDGTSYFMTANHCISTNTVASTLVTYFNYEYASCSGGTTSTSQTISGASLLATNSYSDFTLLLLGEPIPESYHAYFAGWDAGGSVSENSTSIHHPEGIPKCISVDNEATVDYGQRITWDNYSASSPNTHWKVVFDQGSVAGGSSGGPLFNANKRAIGQLHGGGNTDEFYGKLSTSWDHGTTPATQLKVWLDPLNSGVTTMDGSYYNVKPKSGFNGNMQKICLHDIVQFTDKSLYRPDAWEWKITPDTYHYVNSTDSASQNPSVAFNAVDSYSVTLITKNQFGTDTLVLGDYISTVSSIKVQMTGITADSIICGCDLNAYKISATGATDYIYSLDRLDKLTYTSESEDFYVSVIPKEKKNGDFTTWVRVKGIVGSCISSDSAKLNIVMPVNDNIENAIWLLPGKNGVYSDQCASKEIIEPMPATNDCFSNSGWCPGSTNINGSLWFTFMGPASGKINIRSVGHNTRMAVYAADYYSQIISNHSEYSILAANDNVSITDSTSFIKDLSVEHGKLYWLQVDGDTKKFGNMTIELWGNSIEVLPNPSRGLVNVYISTEKYGQAEVNIFSTIGKLMYTDIFEITGETNKIQFDLSHFSTGIYIIYVKIQGEVLQSKLVIVN